LGNYQGQGQGINNLPQYQQMENINNNNNNNIPSSLYKIPSHHNAPSEENNSREQKLDKQKAYREMLHQQVKKIKYKKLK